MVMFYVVAGLVGLLGWATLAYMFFELWFTEDCKVDDRGYEFGDVKLLMVRPKAILVKSTDGATVSAGAERWIPVSQLHDDSEVWQESEVGETGKLVVSTWLARQEGWLDWEEY